MKQMREMQKKMFSRPSLGPLTLHMPALRVTKTTKTVYWSVQTSLMEAQILGHILQFLLR